MLSAETVLLELSRFGLVMVLLSLDTMVVSFLPRREKTKSFVLADDDRPLLGLFCCSWPLWRSVEGGKVTNALPNGERTSKDAASAGTARKRNRPADKTDATGALVVFFRLGC